MKKNYFLVLLLACFSSIAYAQFVDDLEWEASDCPSHWYECPIPTKIYAHSGVQSGWPGSDPAANNPILNLGNKTSGQWGLEFWMYIPLPNEGYMNLQGVVPPTTGEWIVGNIFFNQDTAWPGVGLIDDCFGAPVNFNFPHDEWFKIIMNFDISTGIETATWQFNVNGVDVLPFGTPLTNAAGDYPTSLGGINFYPISASTDVYLDSFNYTEGVITGINDFSQIDFKIYPNPTDNILEVESDFDISKISIYSQLGQRILSQDATVKIDVSNLSSGLYFIEVETESGKGMQKFIKK